MICWAAYSPPPHHTLPAYLTCGVQAQAHRALKQTSALHIVLRGIAQIA